MAYLFKMCTGGKSNRSKKYKKKDGNHDNDDEEEVVMPEGNAVKYHESCRSTDPLNLKKYEKSRDKKAAKGESSSNEPNYVERPYIADENVPWATKWAGYTPIEFTSEKILGGKYDPQDTKLITSFNAIDEKIKLDRRSHSGAYELTEENRPINIAGRTGLSGRGHLGRWGPNHAGDPIVTRWKKDANGKSVKIDGKKVLQFVAIERKDTKDFAIPGGMVDPGEKITETLKREFEEEATNSTQMTAEEKQKVANDLKGLFSKGIEIYKGYVDDPRNTDNAWMETIAYNFHDESGKLFDKVKLHAGDDASKVKWMDMEKSIKLYASHKDFIEKTAKNHKAHW